MVLVGVEEQVAEVVAGATGETKYWRRRARRSSSFAGGDASMRSSAGREYPRGDA